MKKKEFNLISLVKKTTDEILIDEQLDYLGETRYRYFKRYLESQKSFKRKILVSKIVGAVIFGILPIIPLFAYFQILDFIGEEEVPVDIVLFTGSLLFGIYFLLQFFNFFLMAMLNTNKILSGKIFEWFETLPIPRERLRKLVLFTIIRSVDIPLLVIVASLPIVLLIGTQNIMIFFVSIGISVIDALFSLSLLILFSEKISKSINLNEASSRRAHKIRLINLTFYILVILGSIFLIQWAFDSMGLLINWFVNSDIPAIIILILSMIPFPIAPGYLLATFISLPHIPPQIWYNILVGFILFIILTWYLYHKSKKGIEFSTFSKQRPTIKTVRNVAQVTIKIRNPVRAFIRKDLITVSRDLKSFLSVVMPIVISFIFTFTYNSTNVGGITPFDLDFLTNMMIFLGFHIIISAIIVHGLLQIESSGATILASLPLLPRQQAKAKMILMLIIQTFTIISPPFMYIGDDKFQGMLFLSVGTLPFMLLFMILMFQLRIFYFGKMSNSYTIEEAFPEKKTSKWFLIFLIELVVVNVILNFANLLMNLTGFVEMILFLTLSFFFILIILTIIFNKMFPPTVKNAVRRIIGRSFHVVAPIILKLIKYWILLIFLFLSNSLAIYLFNIVPVIPLGEIIFYELNQLFFMIGLNIFLGISCILIIPKVLSFLNRSQSLGQYLESAGLKWLKPFSRVVMSFSLGFFLSSLIYFLLIFVLKINPILAVTTFISILFIFSMLFWHEFIIRGILLSLLIRKHSKAKAILLDALINILSLMWYFLLIFYFNPLIGTPLIILIVICLFFLFQLIGYIYIRTNNMVWGVFILSLIMFLFYIENSIFLI